MAIGRCWDIQERILEVLLKLWPNDAHHRSYPRHLRLHRAKEPLLLLHVRFVRYNWNHQHTEATEPLGSSILDTGYADSGINVRGTVRQSERAFQLLDGYLHGYVARPQGPHPRASLVLDPDPLRRLCPVDSFHNSLHSTIPGCAQPQPSLLRLAARSLVRCDI